jgi:hypothetical protein
MTRSERERGRADEVILFSSVTVPVLGLEAGARDALQPLCKVRRRTPWTYVARVLLHPCNLLMLFGVLLLSFIGWSLPVLLVGLGLEVAALALAPLAGFFRRRIDAQLDEADRAAALKAREALIQQMDVRHQQELMRIERLIDKTHDNVRRHAGVVPLDLGDGLGLGRLTSSYIRLAIAHKAGQESLASTSHQELTDTIRALQSVQLASSDRMRAITSRRLSIAYRRAECWCRTREGLEQIAQQLATILELVHLCHEQSLTPVDPQGACAEIDRFLRELEDNEGTLRELAELAVEEAAPLEELEGERVRVSASS